MQANFTLERVNKGQKHVEPESWTVISLKGPQENRPRRALCDQHVKRDAKVAYWRVVSEGATVFPSDSLSNADGMTSMKPQTLAVGTVLKTDARRTVGRLRLFGKGPKGHEVLRIVDPIFGGWIGINDSSGQPQVQPIPDYDPDAAAQELEASQKAAARTSWPAPRRPSRFSPAPSPSKMFDEAAPAMVRVAYPQATKPQPKPQPKPQAIPQSEEADASRPERSRSRRRRSSSLSEQPASPAGAVASAPGRGSSGRRRRSSQTNRGGDSRDDIVIPESPGSPTATLTGLSVYARTPSKEATLQS